MLLTAGMLLQACARQSITTTTPNLSQYGSQVQGGTRFEREARGGANIATQSGTLLLWTPDYRGMNPLVQAKIDSTLRDLIIRFESRHEQVNIIQKKYSDSLIYKKYSQKVSEGLGPDLILIHNFMIPQLSQKNEILPIPAKVAKFQSIRPKLLRSMQNNEKQYAMPFIINVQLLCYDKRKVPVAPKNFDQLISVSKSGVSTAFGGNFIDNIWGLPGFHATLFGGVRSSRETLKNGLAEWISLLRGADEQPNLALFKSSRIMAKYFSQGKISLMNCASIDLPFLREKIGSENLGVAMLPAVNGIDARPRLTGASLAANPFMSKNQKELAFRFMNFAISTDQQQQISIDWNSLLPVNKNSDFNRELLPVFEASEKSLGASFSLTSKELATIVNKFDIIQGLFEDATAGLTDPTQASDEILDQLEIKQ